MSNRERGLLTVTVKMLKPKNNVDQYLEYKQCDVIYKISTIYRNDLFIEVYSFKDFFEWRIIELIKNDTGTTKKSVLFDSVEGLYGNAESALRDALIFCTLEIL